MIKSVVFCTLTSKVIIYSSQNFVSLKKIVDKNGSQERCISGLVFVCYWYPREEYLDCLVGYISLNSDFFHISKKTQALENSRNFKPKTQLTCSESTLKDFKPQFIVRFFDVSQSCSYFHKGCWKNAVSLSSFRERFPQNVAFFETSYKSLKLIEWFGKVEGLWKKTW